MRKIALAIGLVAAAVAGYAIAAIGPTGPGQFYYYYDSAGKVVGYQAIDCRGNYTARGRFTKQYADGVFICDPDPI